MDINGKSIVILGSTGGIGSEIAKTLHKEDAKLILIAKDLERLDSLNKSLGNQHTVYSLDLSNQNEVIDFVHKFDNKVDIFINCAGIGVYKQIEDIELGDWNDTFNIGLTSTFLFTKEIIKKKIYSSDALFLNIGSGAGVIPMSGRSLYCASKFALRGFILSLVEEFKRIKNPKFCLITLGSTLTGFGPMTYEQKKEDMEKGKAYFTPEWVAEKMVEIIKDDSREVEYTLYPGDYGFGEWKKPDPK